MDRHGIEDALHRALAARLADLRRVVRHLLEDLEDVPFRALVFVDWHPIEG
jgi:hypothetical protein